MVPGVLAHEPQRLDQRRHHVGIAAVDEPGHDRVPLQRPGGEDFPDLHLDFAEFVRRARLESEALRVGGRRTGGE